MPHPVYGVPSGFSKKVSLPWSWAPIQNMSETPLSTRKFYKTKQLVKPKSTLDDQKFIPCVLQEFCKNFVKNYRVGISSKKPKNAYLVRNWQKKL